MSATTPIVPFNKRLNEALELKGIKPSELSKRTGIAEATISQYRSGYTKPKEKKLQLLAKALNVNPAWLMGYDVTVNGNIEESDNDDDVLKKKLLMYIYALKELHPTQQEIVFSVLDTMVEKYSKENNNAEE